MARIVIYTGGTMGDHLPFIALGQGLVARGHQVRIAVNQDLLSYAQRAGLEAAPVRDVEHSREGARRYAWSWDAWNNPEPLEDPRIKPLDLEQHMAQVAALAALCRDADLLITTPIRGVGYVVAAAVRLPWMTASVNPAHFWKPAATQGREVWQQQQRQRHELIRPLVDYSFAHLGLAEGAPPWSPDWLLARHVLLASSPHFSLPDLNQFQPGSSIDVTGFWFFQDPDWENWRPDEVLRRFCEPEDPDRCPIALTFSSQPLENPGEILVKHVLAAQRLGRPLLVQRGWADFSEADLPTEVNPEMVLFADYLPHDWLFARCACAIQHGGIGSIARALRQGCPLLIEPFGNDQIYNATRVVDLGVGAAMHPFEATVEGIVENLRQVVLAPETRQRAAALGEKLRAEHGVETACQYIERYLERLGERWEHPAIYGRFTPPLTPRRQR